MLRKLIVCAFIFVVAGGIYVSRGTFETVGAMALTARDLFFSDKSSVAETAPASSAGTLGASKPAALTGFAAKFSNSLMMMVDGTPKDLDAHKLAGVKYWAFYYSASWCGPCREFTPGLVSFYKHFKPSHPDFELIFVNLDQSQDDMLKYMRADGMTWPAIWYPDIDNPELEAKKYAGPGIPCLVLVDADGRVLSDSFQGEQYVGPQHVIDDIRAVVK